MTPDDEIGWRRSELREEFGRDLKHYYGLGRVNYRVAYALRTGIVAFSIVAGAIGLAQADARLVGIVAFLPAALTLYSSRMKFQDRANWHYRKAEALDGLRQELLYELPNPPTTDAIKDISRRKRDMSAAMSREWEKLFGSDTDLVKDPPHVTTEGGKADAG